MSRIMLTAVMIALAASGADAMETIAFPAGDGLEVSADLYLAHPLEAPFIILFHMAGSSRGEYRPIAARLNELGFNAMAIDQRSGGGSNGVSNETAARARTRKLPSSWIDALPDMRAAVGLARQRYAKGKLILWGSSYSASLALKIAGEDPGSCDAVLAFSPGEYFGGSGLIAASAKGIKVPAFITSGKYERDDWQKIYDAIPAPGKVSFLPGSSTEHGSPALDPAKPASGECWVAVKAFLAGVK